MAETPKSQGRVRTGRGGITPSAPTTGFKPSTGGTAVVRPSASNSDRHAAALRTVVERVETLMNNLSVLTDGPLMAPTFTVLRRIRDDAQAALDGRAQPLRLP
jgi:hypothetical protein